MGKLRIVTLGTVLAAASVFSPLVAHATGCPTANVDFEIVVHFSGIAGDSANCPLSVEPVAVVGTDAAPCTSGKPNCIRKEKGGGGATKVRWRSDPEGINFAVFFSPFVGPTIKTNNGSNGCATETIKISGADNVPPFVPGTTVLYKYTIAAIKLGGSPADDEAVAVCPPLDPDVYIEH